MAHYNLFIQDSSPLFIYSPPGAWTDTPFKLDDSPFQSYHATDVQNATVELDFVGTGVRVFSATVPVPGSYEVFVDGQSLSDLGHSQLDSQLLLGSITGLEMAPHTVALVNYGLTEDILDLTHVEVESVLTSGSSFSAAIFDDTIDEIHWGPGWVSAFGGSTLYNSTVHYTEQPDAEMRFSFEGDAIAIHGTSGTKIGYYAITLDGQSTILNGGSDGSVTTHHDRTILYLANGLGAGRHELTITANPSSLGDALVFNIDCISVLSGSSSSGPAILPPGSSDTGTSLTLPTPVSTGSSYSSVITPTVFSTPMPFPTSIWPILSPILMTSSSPALSPTAGFDKFDPSRILQSTPNSGSFGVLTEKWVTSGFIISAVTAGIGVVFFALFVWKRKTLNPPSCMDLEMADGLNEKRQGSEPGNRTPELPIQPVEKASPADDYSPFAEGDRTYAQYQSPTVIESAYDSYRETLYKRAQLTDSVVSTDNTYRDSISDHGSKSRGKSVGSISSLYSEASRYSQVSERILINNVMVPPQFLTPTRPLVIASPPRLERTPPPRPPRVRESLALPF